MKEHQHRGLTSAQVEESRRLHGDNLITPRKGDSAWKLFAEKFRDPIIQVLLVAALLSLAMAFIDGEFLETIGIICAIVLATCVGFFFELDAMRRFKRLNLVNDDIPVKVVRDGEMTEVPRRDVVVGDLVYVENGETVPADGKLVKAVSLKINESTLTGEPEVDKTTDECFFDAEATYPSDALLRGTTVVDGYGEMIVEAVGDRTEAGRVTEQSSIASEEPTPLYKQLTRLSRMIGKIGIAVSIAIFVAMLAKAYLGGELSTGDWVQTSKELLRIFMVSVALIVMAVPEGLPMSITLSLALSMRRMLKTNNLVRKMHACETMGAVTVICTDKTGTLTQNRMRVEEIIHYASIDERLLAEIIAVNSTAFLDADANVIGNPTEGALLIRLREEGFDYAALREEAPIVDRMTFTTERKYMATIIQSKTTGKRLICVKGAPEIVRAMCMPDGKDAQVNEQLLLFQGRAMRTLAVAYAETTAERCEDALRDPQMLFVAVAAIADPVREDVPAAVARCMKAGIDIKIVTGDTPATAREIARRIGLWHDETDSSRNEMTGVEFAAMSDEELLERVQALKIMSRARPLDKQRLVRLLQRKGEIVAVTGDGTNDAPALNFANVGLSMGSGTSVAKDASDITLLDDSFTSIASAVMWGAFALPQYPTFRTVSTDDQFRGDHRGFRRFDFRDRDAAYGSADSVGQYHHGHFRCAGDGFPAAQSGGDERTAASQRRVYHHTGHGPDDLYLRNDFRRRIARYAVLLACYDRRAQSRTTDRFLLCIRLSAVLEYVQRQRLRSVPFGAARSAGKPYVLLGAAVDRRRTGIDRGIRRSGVPYYAAHVGTMARSDRLYLSDRYSGRCRAEYPPPHPSPSRLSVSGENRFFRCGRNLVFGK